MHKKSNKIYFKKELLVITIAENLRKRCSTLLNCTATQPVQIQTQYKDNSKSQKSKTILSPENSSELDTMKLKD